MRKDELESRMNQARKNKNWKLLLQLTKEHAKVSWEESNEKYDKNMQARKAKLQELDKKTKPLQKNLKKIKDKASYAIDQHVPCPNCKSKNTNLTQNDLQASRTTSKAFAGLIFLPLAFFVGNKKLHNGECFDCGKKWAIN